MLYCTQLIQKMFNLYCLGIEDFKSHGIFGTNNQILTQVEIYQNLKKETHHSKDHAPVQLQWYNTWPIRLNKFKSL